MPPPPVRIRVNCTNDMLKPLHTSQSFLPTIITSERSEPNPFSDFIKRRDEPKKKFTKIKIIKERNCILVTTKISTIQKTRMSFISITSDFCGSHFGIVYRLLGKANNLNID